MLWCIWSSNAAFEGCRPWIETQLWMLSASEDCVCCRSPHQLWTLIYGRLPSADRIYPHLMSLNCVDITQLGLLYCQYYFMTALGQSVCVQTHWQETSQVVAVTACEIQMPMHSLHLLASNRLWYSPARWIFILNKCNTACLMVMCFLSHGKVLNTILCLLAY